MISRIGGRKAVGALVLVSVGAAVDLTTQRGLSEHFLALLSLVYISYTAGNSFSKFAAAKVTQDKSKEAEVLAQQQLAQAVQELNQQYKVVTDGLEAVKADVAQNMQGTNTLASGVQQLTESMKKIISRV